MATWQGRRSTYVTPENADRVAQHAESMLGEVRAVRLADARKRRNLTQEAVSVQMRVSQTRVSQIERGEISRTEVETLAAYVQALGGRLELIADFGDERLVIG